jgi:hypothetical protein
MDLEDNHELSTAINASSKDRGEAMDHPQVVLNFDSDSDDENQLLYTLARKEEEEEKFQVGNYSILDSERHSTVTEESLILHAPSPEGLEGSIYFLSLLSIG